MKLVPPVHTGEYLRLASREKPPEELAAAMGMPIPPALQSAEKEEVTRE
jgi:NAD(P)H-quinone oxidoreductase subunit K